MAVDRPAVVETAYLEFLDTLREMGTVNMFGAAVPLRQEFPILTRQDAHTVLHYWMESFSERHPE